jgi:hypothetical protein
MTDADPVQTHAQLEAHEGVDQPRDVARRQKQHKGRVAPHESIRDRAARQKLFLAPRWETLRVCRVVKVEPMAKA